MNIHLQYSSLFNETNEFLIGAGAEFKKLVPRLYSQGDKNLKDGIDSIYYAGDENVSSYALSVYTKLRLKPLTIKAYAIYGRNMFDMVMLGGYAVTSIDEKNQMSYEYSSVKNVSLWTELSTNGRVQAGIFAGYTKNIGTDSDNAGVYYSRGSNINYVYRVSPRLAFNLAKVRISTELEYTSAQYGKADTKGVVNSNLSTVSNLRVLTAFYYFF
jgi:hypothetical protein